MGNTSLELKGMKVQRRVRSVRASALVTCPGGNYFSRSEGIFFVPLLLGFDAPEILRFSALPPSFVTQSNMNRHQKNEFISYLLIILVHISVFHSIWATATDIVCSRFRHGDKYVVPPERINDNYCDCPVDGGIDETNTEACSGAVDGAWLGMDLPQHISPPYFQCQTYTKQKIPLSRVNDGICDCCDGSDEADSRIISCKDTCDEILAKENAAKKRMIEEFQLGNDIRNRDIEQFQTLLQTNNQLIHDIQSMEIDPLQSELDSLESSIQEEKLAFMDQYFQKMHTAYLKVASILPGSIENLKMLIEAACHLQGEMSDPNSSQVNSCIALKMAGLDSGIIWSEDMDQVSVRKGGIDDKVFTLELYHIMMTSSTEVHNTQQARQPRPTPDYDDDDYYHSDRTHDDPASDSESVSGQSSRALSVDPDPSFTSVFKLLRRPFYTQAKKVLRAIDTKLRQALDIQSQLLDDSGADDSKLEEMDSSNWDSSQLRIIHDQLSRKLANVERGVSWSKSARKYLQALEAAENEESFKSDLIKLAAGTVFYSRIRGVDIVEIVSFYGLNLDEYSNVCLLPTMVFCPARTKEYVTLSSGTLISFPNESLLKDTIARCDLEQSERYSHVCSQEEDETVQLNDIINSTSDGYFHYFEHTPRDVNDHFTTQFIEVEDAQMGIESIIQKESHVSNLRRKIDDAHGKIRDLEGETGGNASAYGGILFTLRDKCFEVKNGKYIYEVCIFGNAYQREDQGETDKKSQKGTGTFLGKWHGFSSDEDYARKIMKWTDGTRCFQGTARSATVFVSCGSETLLLSAEEPNTCEYVLTMQSHIACDDIYKTKYCSQLSFC